MYIPPSEYQNGTTPVFENSIRTGIQLRMLAPVVVFGATSNQPQLLQESLVCFEGAPVGDDGDKYLWDNTASVTEKNRLLLIGMENRLYAVTSTDCSQSPNLLVDWVSLETTRSQPTSGYQTGRTCKWVYQ
ncbi:hypothetical protein BGX38DRAFT_1140882 [Terfezia claveryi]|nr:hypothetical protein BGX38DRAFT_1140882 [Terfezia claveryi]